MKISYIIDGYNILHALGLLNTKAGDGQLQEARSRLLEYLGKSFGDRSARVTVVFDAKRSRKIAWSCGRFFTWLGKVS